MKRKYALDILRIIATVLIVFRHLGALVVVHISDRIKKR